MARAFENYKNVIALMILAILNLSAMPESNLSSVMSLFQEMNTKIDTMAKKIDAIEKVIVTPSNAQGERLSVHLLVF